MVSSEKSPRLDYDTCMTLKCIETAYENSHATQKSLITATQSKVA